ncbi:hypothetical protein OESDEN_12443 [Oesophagostomum dentatum]|uniref:Gamma interferon inducible lysosomal thiol reductase n=1 Tax=Oesophagostomum dentatum TaxID=61180 RepID=A0A0B1SS44_OESDE|nr:hypothetical protein OESDEN_12443 [Oesophagostomum dentatum]
MIMASPRFANICKPPRCSCEHGPDECHKNYLQACVIKTLVNPEDYMDIVGCIQGLSNYSTSYENCIVGNRKLNQQSIYECSNSREGKALMVQHGEASRKIAPDVFWVPWISINGQRIPEAEHHFEQVLCLQYFKPPPPQCKNIRT